MKIRCIIYIILCLSAYNILFPTTVLYADIHIFSNIRNLETLNSKSDDFAPHFYPSNSILFFNSDRSGNSLFYKAKLQDTFGISELISDPINSRNENQAYISFINPNEAIISKFVQFENRSNLNLFKINYRNGRFSQAKAIENISKNYYISQPSTCDDSKYIYFVADFSSPSKNTDIYSTHKSDFFNQYTPLKEINSPDSEITPFLKSEDSLYFASNGLGGKGGYDVFLSVKIDGVWQRPQPLDEINTEYNESDFIIINDTLAVFASDRLGGKGKMDLYAASIVQQNQGKQIENVPAISQNINITASGDDNITINKTIERSFVQVNGKVESLNKIKYDFEPLNLTYNIDFVVENTNSPDKISPDKLQLDSLVFFVNGSRINQKLSLDKNHQVKFPLAQISDCFKEDLDEIEVRLELYNQGQKKAHTSKKNINENESISNRLSNYKGKDYFALEITDYSKEAVEQVENFLRDNGFAPQYLLLNIHSENQAGQLKSAISRMNKKISIESVSGVSMLYFEIR